MRKAREAAEVHRQWLKQRTVVFVGRLVSQSFGWPKDRLNFFEWAFDLEDEMFISVIPHPSGCNMFYNQEENREKLRQFMQAMISSGEGFTSAEVENM